MKKFIVETYYTCTFKTIHTLNELNDQELAKIDSRNDGSVEVIEVKLNNRKTKKIGDIKIPMLTITAVMVIFFCWCLLEQTNFGRRLYAIGGNKEASHLAGIKVVRLRIIAFTLTGFGAAAAGLMYASRVASANPTQGSGLMLDAIAAVLPIV